MRAITMLLISLALLPLPAAAASQPPSAEISVGYAYLHDEDVKGMPRGWCASAAFHLTDVFALVGDVGANYKTETFPGLPGNVKETITSFQAGPRLTARGDSASVWVQALAGGTRASVRFQGDSVTDSETHFSVQPGVGVDLRLTDSLALRAGGDYRRVFISGGGVNEYRAHGGLVFYFGTR